MYTHSTAEQTQSARETKTDSPVGSSEWILADMDHKVWRSMIHDSWSMRGWADSEQGLREGSTC
eukprot:173802-Prorocentrum_minimum.AAC.1